jgi:hypothetical protein
VGCFRAIAALAFVFGCWSAPASRRGLSTRRRYFNAELLQVTHRISCPAPGRSSTAPKPLDRAVYAETRSCLSVPTAFGNSARSGPPAMRAAKRNGPSAQRGHRLKVIPVYDSSASWSRHSLSVPPTKSVQNCTARHGVHASLKLPENQRFKIVVFFALLGRTEPFAPSRYSTGCG